jgi:hypothetical protein
MKVVLRESLNYIQLLTRLKNDLWNFHQIQILSSKILIEL